MILSIEEYERLKANQQKEDWREVLDRALRLGKEISARRGGEPLPDPADIIHQMREERDEQIRQAIGLR